MARRGGFSSGNKRRNVIEGRLIVCIGSAWDYDPTSKHHLMRILSRRNRVLWVNYHASRKPRLNRADAGASLRTLRRVFRGVEEVTPTFSQLTPMVIPGASRALWQGVHERMLVAQIRRAVRGIDPDGVMPVQVWSFAPDVPFLVGALNEECFLYYCVDEFRLFEDFDGPRIARLERELLDRATLVVSSSRALHDSKRTVRPDAVHVPHGVDYDHFAACWRWALPEPDDIADLNGPRFGYFGLIQHWVDIEFLAKVASLRPGYSFVMIGDARADVAPLRRLSNVRLLGRRPHETLPAYCGAFDAGMLLFKRNDMTRHVNPIKLHEYLAAGLRVVSTPLPEAGRFPGAVSIADTPERFAEVCDGIARSDGARLRPSISALVENETWTSRVELLSSLVAARLGKATAPTDKPVHDVLPSTSRQCVGTALVDESLVNSGAR